MLLTGFEPHLPFRACGWLLSNQKSRWRVRGCRSRCTPTRPIESLWPPRGTWAPRLLRRTGHCSSWPRTGTSGRWMRPFRYCAAKYKKVRSTYYPEPRRFRIRICATRLAIRSVITTSSDATMTVSEPRPWRPLLPKFRRDSYKGFSRASENAKRMAERSDSRRRPPRYTRPTSELQRSCRSPDLIKWYCGEPSLDDPRHVLIY